MDVNDYRIETEYWPSRGRRRVRVFAPDGHLAASGWHDTEAEGTGAAQAYLSQLMVRTAQLESGEGAD